MTRQTFQWRLPGATDRAEIVVHRETLLPGRWVDQYEWRGPATALATVDLDFLMHVTYPLLQSDPATVAQALRLLPWPVRIVDHEFWSSRVLVARTDGPRRVSAAYWTARAWWLNHWRLIKSRLIVTAHVWGIGFVEAGTIPDWDDLWRKRP